MVCAPGCVESDGLALHQRRDLAKQRRAQPVREEVLRGGGHDAFQDEGATDGGDEEDAVGRLVAGILSCCRCCCLRRFTYSGA